MLVGSEHITFRRHFISKENIFAILKQGVNNIQFNRLNNWAYDIKTILEFHGMLDIWLAQFDIFIANLVAVTY